MFGVRDRDLRAQLGETLASLVGQKVDPISPGETTTWMPAECSASGCFSPFRQASRPHGGRVSRPPLPPAPNPESKKGRAVVRVNFHQQIEHDVEEEPGEFRED